MNVGRSVSKAIDEWEANDSESAMLHACNAIDGTAKKKNYPSGNNSSRFTKLLRDNYEILGILGMPGIDLERTLFPISLGASGNHFLDLADILYKVHRCTHGHGDELEHGFSLRPDAAGPSGYTSFEWNFPGKLMLSDRIIFGMIAVAVGAEENITQKATGNHYLTIGNSEPLLINDWWGRREDFILMVTSLEMPSVFMDFSKFEFPFSETDKPDR
ncbi:hypothetical protein G6L86_18705 [Agrobacterium tumefaciens]|uniref:hypothetical protein n=1 Tax=Agrobacterium tumefaciens TaxID=358 RepID=UPI001573C957|nr:hypothetical protein [Agrobacterium tumefaciens]NSX87638.1 hypothetical protein [Agrobacterium tumefaciens]